MTNEEKAYDVMVNGKIAGYCWGPGWGGLVYAPDNHNIIGAIRHDPDIDFYWLDASAGHHTGKEFQGDKVYVDNKRRGTK